MTVVVCFLLQLHNGLSSVRAASPSLQLPWPVATSHNISRFGCSYDCPPYHLDRDFYAIDFNLLTDSQVSAVLAGIAHLASYLCWDSTHTYSSTSYLVWVDHGGGLISYYAHLDPNNISVHEGQTVSQGQLLALSDTSGGPYCATGPHLHFAMHSAATTWNNGNAYMPEPMSGYTGFGGYGVMTGLDSPAYTSLNMSFTVDGLFGDIIGNGLDDLVAVNDNNVWMMQDTQTGFGPPACWWNCSGGGSPHPPYGTNRTLLGDVNGDGKADLVALDNTGTWVMTSTGAKFNDPVSWQSTPFYGTRAALLGDVNGDGKLDLVAVNEDSIWVMLSTGSGFQAPVQWFQATGTAPWGTRATLLADVSGDGKADVIAERHEHPGIDIDWVRL